MTSPLASTTALILFGMLSIKLLHKSGEISFQRCSNCSHNCSTLLNGPFEWILHLINHHKFSIGFKSGDFAGKSITLIFFFQTMMLFQLIYDMMRYLVKNTNQFDHQHNKEHCFSFHLP